MDNLKLNNFSQFNSLRSLQNKNKSNLNLSSSESNHQVQQKIKENKEKSAIQMAYSIVAGLLTAEMFQLFFKQSKNKSSRWGFLAGGLGCGVWFINSLKNLRASNKNN